MSNCNDSVSNSDCVNSTCTCNPGHQVSANLDQCIKRRVGDTCIQNDNCLQAVNNSICSNSSCECDNGFYPADYNTTCNPFRIMDPGCISSDECASSISNSTCNLTSTLCLCRDGFAPSADLAQCNLRTITTNCTSNLECSVIDNSFCNQSTGGSNSSGSSGSGNSACDCLTGYYPTAQNTQCIPYSIGTPCNGSATDDCMTSVGNSSCDAVSDTCKCLDGFKASEDGVSCTIRTLTDNCTVNVDCSAAVPNSECGGVTNSSCVCSMGYEQGNSAGRECNELKPGSTCDGDSQCVAAMGNSHCNSTNVCECDTGYAYSNATTSCDQNKVGAPCSTNQDCSTVNQTECNSTTSTCDCMAGYTQNPDGTDCHQRVLEEDTCTTDSECSYDVSNSLCGTSGTCKCETGHDASATKTACQLRKYDIISTTLFLIATNN